MGFRHSMIARLLLVGTAAVVCSGAQTSCSTGDVDRLPDTGDGPTFATTLALKDSAGVERYSFERGEFITFELTVRNRTAQTVEVTSPNGQQFEFMVLNNGASQTRWKWSADKFFTMATTRIEFAPNESKVFSVTWNQVLLDGSSLPAGRFEGRGALMFDALWNDPLAPHELGSSLRDFTIR